MDDWTDRDFDRAEGYLAEILEHLAKEPRAKEMSAYAAFREVSRTIRAHVEALVEIRLERTIN